MQDANSSRSTGSDGAAARLAEALDHHEAGRLEEAERLYLAILALDPEELARCSISARSISSVAGPSKAWN